MSLYLVGMAERRLTKWQEKWMLIEDESGDQVGEYLRKTDQENATSDWCKVTFKYCMSGVTLVFACLGFLSPANRGALMTCALVLFVCLGTPAGLCNLQ